MSDFLHSYHLIGIVSRDTGLYTKPSIILNCVKSRLETEHLFKLAAARAPGSDVVLQWQMRGISTPPNRVTKPLEADPKADIAPCCLHKIK